MTDQQIGAALTQAVVLEREARAHWQVAPDVAERDAALSMVRLVTPVIRALEQWITARALRVAQPIE